MSDPRLEAIVEDVLAIGRLASWRTPENSDLTSTQWAALHYFSRANERSQTAAAFSRYYGASPGSVSEILDILARRGLIEREPLAGDRRSTRIRLTDEARRRLRHEPSGVLLDALRELTETDLQSLSGPVLGLVKTLAARTGAAVWGPCRRCVHSAPNGGDTSGGVAGVCRKFGTELSAEALEQLCAKFEPA